MQINIHDALRLSDLSDNNLHFQLFIFFLQYGCNIIQKLFRFLVIVTSYLLNKSLKYTHTQLIIANVQSMAVDLPLTLVNGVKACTNNTKKACDVTSITLLLLICLDRLINLIKTFPCIKYLFLTSNSWNGYYIRRYCHL